MNTTNTNTLQTYPQVQAIPHTAKYMEVEKQIKQSFGQFLKGAGFVAAVSIVSENQLLGFSFFEMNVVLGIAGGLFALQGFIKAYIANFSIKASSAYNRATRDDTIPFHIAGNSYSDFRHY